LTVYARWDLQIYNVIFAVDGSIIQQTYTLYGEDVLPPEEPIKEGFEFSGWNHTSSSVTSDLWIEAQFEKTFTINTYYLDPSFSQVNILMHLEDNIYKQLAGERHTAILTDSGRIFIWGSNQYYQLGDGTTQNSGIPKELIIHQLTENEKIIDLAVGRYHTLILTSEGRVFGWGRNYNGEIGNNNTNPHSVPTEVTFFSNLPSEDKVVSIYAGFTRSAAQTKNGEIYMWGSIFKSLNNGTSDYNNQLTPLNVTSQFNLSVDELIVKIVFSLSMNVVLTNKNQLFTWGLNNHYQLGNNTTNSSSPVSDISNLIELEPNEYIVDLTVGDDHGMILTSNHRVFRWGRNNFYQLGTNDIANMIKPTLLEIELADGDYFTGIAAGINNSFLWTSQNQIYGMGDNFHNQFLVENTQPLRIPTNVTQHINPNGEEITEIIIAGYLNNTFQQVHFFGTQLYSWGINLGLQLGTGSVNNSDGIGKVLIYKPIKLDTHYQLPFTSLNVDLPTLPGYIFKGWYTDIELNSPFEGTTMPDEDLTLYAKWEKE
jgi:uncharacterized repeat protein (TIGR02543 family)